MWYDIGVFSEENDGGDQDNQPEEVAILKVNWLFSASVIPVMEYNNSELSSTKQFRILTVWHTVADI